MAGSRRWAGVGAALALVLTLVGWLTTDAVVGGRTAWAAGKPAREYLACYGVVDELREKFRISNEYLAAIGCSRPVAEVVLKTMLIWCRANRARLEALRIVWLHNKLRRAMRKLHAGTADKALRDSIPELKKAYADAQKKERAIHQTFVTSVEAVMPYPQRTVWRKLRATPPTFGDFRFVGDLTTEETKALDRLNRKYQRRLAAATNDRERGAQGAWFNRETKGALTKPQRTALKKARDNLKRYMNGVLKAKQRVLPLPEELRNP